jgi:hypothetical protein
MTNLEQSNAKEAMDIRSSKNSPKQLTQVNMMVVDTISGSGHHFLSKIKNFAEGFVELRFNINNG